MTAVRLVDYFNSDVCRYSGPTRAQWAGAGWLNVVYPRDCGRVSKRWSQSLTTRDPYEIEVRIRAHDSSYRWFSVQAAAVPCGDAQIRWLGSCVAMERNLSRESALVPRCQEARGCE